MKKCLMSMLALMVVAAVSLCFVSCGDDDDDPKISIVGTWTFDYGRLETANGMNFLRPDPK